MIIFAFPKAGTPGCNNQACEFRDEFPKLESHNAVVLGVSADSPTELLSWKMAKKLPYDLLSDPDHTMLKAYGAWGMGFGIIKLPVITRSVWVIDENGIIVDMEIGVGPKSSVERAIRALNAQAVQA
ncbi:MAG: peroxiredoxin [Phototrophicales bacterium]|nr:MAG: peroxiredoxin [Phototrophicales bacterium]